MERDSLDENTLEIQLTEELPWHRPLMVFAGGIAGMADRQTERGYIHSDLGNKDRATTASRLDRAAQGLAVTDQLIKIRCATVDLGYRPVTDWSTKSRHVNLLEEVAERVRRWWSTELQAERLGEHDVMLDGEWLQIAQALEASQDAQYGHKQQIPGRGKEPYASSAQRGSTSGN
jgi:hypothetical protein